VLSSVRALDGKIFNTWDRFLLPYPFSKGVFIWGERVYVDVDSNLAHLEEMRLLLEQRLNQLTEMADGYFEKSFLSPETKERKEDERIPCILEAERPSKEMRKEKRKW
jgi:hypothetical protein